MNRTRVKICGVRRSVDAIAAARAGADAVGLVLHPAAKRNVEIRTARDILAVLPPFVTPVGLFVDATIPHILKTTHDLGLRHVQLNGQESPEFVANLPGLRVVKAIRVNRDTFTATLDLWRRSVAQMDMRHLTGLVLEPDNTGHAGGSGVANDWAAVVDAATRGAFEGLPPIIAAGGLSPDNVADVVRAVRPYAVDVSSGVEDGVIGEKSAAKIAAFVAAVALAERG
ncbi:MAG TPA: phosphoribosylanthranilate isomerase [Tepidisphaeraceae bacterium]|jgi:phosphoribosylanthranilate isomerase|nr:phosphoribosylanthranilate isomerase [Tepidisphaeraceae bacterium]